MTKVKFEERGILAGLVEINKEYQDFLSDIHEIVEDDLKIYMNKKDVIENHWIFKYPEKDYYGVYYKPGHHVLLYHLEKETFENVVSLILNKG
ncbi:hypothetical protein [Bacillus phage PM1]|uniref:Uncharacterized protein n=1 Tax=Bacillus phage PM1 TaxID=547228 RepID=M4ZR52_9CAUD|nr:hypothetical protein K203_gp01 [Bacillus phage PM1]BAM99167.1 hypothetical protein [Bacillus phage PM1]